MRLCRFGHFRHPWRQPSRGPAARPFRAPQRRGSPQQYRRVVGVAEKAPTVLVVDDAPFVGEALRLLLEPDPLVVEVLTDAPRVEAAAVTARPDLVLLDVVLPSGGGLVLCGVGRGGPPEGLVGGLTHERWPSRSSEPWRFSRACLPYVVSRSLVPGRQRAHRGPFRISPRYFGAGFGLGLRNRRWRQSCSTTTSARLVAASVGGCTPSSNDRYGMSPLSFGSIRYRPIRLHRTPPAWPCAEPRLGSSANCTTSC